MTTQNLLEFFLAEEFKAARTRIDQEINSMNNFEIACVGAIGAIVIYTLQSNPADQFLLLASTFVCVFISVYGLARYIGQRALIKRYDDYIVEKIETLVRTPTNEFIGMTSFYRSRGHSGIGIFRYILWFILIVVFSILFYDAYTNPAHLLALMKKPT